MPDWRNAEDYAYTKGLSLHQWAWEFLRRDPEYRAAYGKFLERSHSLEAYMGACFAFGLEEPTDPDATALELDVPFSDYVGRKLLNDPSPAVDDDRDPGQPLTEVPLNFDVTMPLGPQLNKAAEILGNFQNWWRTWAAEEDRITVEELRIRPRSKFEKKHFLRQIRLLDGSDQGASIGELGRVLFPNHMDSRRSAKKALKRAEVIAHAGYLDMLKMSP